MIRTAAALALLVAPALPARAAQAPEPYRDPPFACEVVVDYGTDAPTVPAPPQDPLCVRYDKTNITVSTLEAVDFLAAEPGRVAIVAGKCSYWQRDHWIVRATPESPPIVEWEGSYWYDGRTGSAAGIMRGLRVGGQPADGEAFVAALAPLIGEEAAAELATYAADGGGGGASFALPEGFGGCGQPAATTTATTTGPPAGTPPDASAPGAPDGVAGDGARRGVLPATGAAAPAASAGLALLAAAALRAVRRRSA